jgi:hypothetical protein
MKKSARNKIVLNPELSIIPPDQSPYSAIQLEKIEAAFGRPKYEGDWAVDT